MTRLAAIVAALTAAVAVGVAQAAAPSETVRFRAVAKSGVAGTATLGANGIGTRVAVRITGLAPGATARVLVRSGRWPKLGASVAKAVVARADAAGVARATSAVRYRNLPVSFAVVADGDHLLTVVVDGRVVAIAEIPGME